MPKDLPIKMPVLLPSDLLSWLYHNHRYQFNRRIVGSADGKSLQDFWSSCKADDGLVWNHPSLQGLERSSQLRSLVPLANHGDGVPITRPGASSASLQVVSVNSLTGLGDVLDTHFLYSAYPSTIVVKPQPRLNLTSRPLQKALVWDLRNCGMGAASHFLQAVSVQR